jgi:ABC-type nickel/cobalt efflux system permease component RcnA
MDISGIWRYANNYSFFGAPFIWTTLHNMGANDGMKGATSQPLHWDFVSTTFVAVNESPTFTNAYTHTHTHTHTHANTHTHTHTHSHTHTNKHTHTHTHTHHCLSLCLFVGNMDWLAKMPSDAIAAGASIIGTGATPEGIDQNPP